MKIKIRFIAFGFFMFLCFMPDLSKAQDNNVLNDMVERLKFRQPEVQINQIPSLFFTSDEAALVAAVRSGVIARPPTERELNEDPGEEATPEPGIRELALGGIVYRSSSDWTIWVNGEKMTPERIHPQILDIKVRKSHVQMKWFDPYTNQVFPIRLKPHQRFNIDTRIFLPG